MSLVKYKQKRNFKSTAEPVGTRKKSNGALTFVVQKHAASHLHYDFRLEMDGVLKSWAVPKGPSMNPDDKRLAMMVEDHPYSYKDFEGNIPEGNYGAGNVIVWDNGTYHDISHEDKKESEKSLLKGLQKGHLSFSLNGKKLKGEFSLVKLKGKQENAWLLIKKNDRYASDDDVLKKNKSVLSKSTLEQLEKKSTNKAAQERPKKKSQKKVEIKAKSMGSNPPTEKIEPMLAELGDKPFDDENWIFEKKYDGYRTLASFNGKGEVELFSRNHLSFNDKFRPIAEELKKVKHAAVLDGEVVVEDEKGISRFQLLQNYQRTGQGRLKYYVFDILFLNGNDTRVLPVTERKELLKLLVQKARFKNIIYSDHVKGKGKSFYDQAVKQNLEGIIAKDARSPYRSGRRISEWLKIKISQEEEAVIIGITEPKGSRSHFGSLLLAQYKGKQLKYAGHCGTGFSEAVLEDLYKQLKPYFTDQSPLKEKIKANGKVQWIKPEIICQVKFTEWTGDGIMRHPVFLGLREDKSPEEVKQPKKAMPTKTKGASADKDLKIGKVTLHLTNQQKVYFPDDKITKGDIVNYYNEAASLILPYLKDRPQSMNRFPNGIKGPSFFQKDVDVEKSPSWIKTEKIFSESTKEFIDYLLCNDKATLLYMANLGCIEINPWNSRVSKIENPDWMVIDLDPEKIDFKHVVTVAREVKKLMDELEAECYCKTSGATGLHIFVPLAAKYDYDTVKTFAHVIAQKINERLPDITSIERLPKKRQHKVYIDFLQNRRGQTLAAPYSVRPKPGATVSTPLEWKEVNEKLNPADFTIHTILKRVEKKGDLWKPVTGKGVNLNRVIKKIQQD